jgi:endonuclease/exonuclease/phosphatase family metal-dependent hydrolase
VPARSGDDGGAFALVPTRSMQTVRIMSWNVLRSSPVDNAAPFARVVGAIKPDIILLQEWDYAAPQLAGWFTALIDARGWNGVALESSGVSIVSGYPLEAVGEPLVLDANETRFVAAIASSPIGPIFVGSTHLTCCGAAGDERDRRRQLEAGAINAWVSSWLDGAGVTMRVLGGDMNLVGSRAPIDTLVAGLSDDAEDLSIAEAYVLGDAAQYTWSDPGNAFTPGRLDYIAAGGSELEIVRAFVLDTRRLSDAALARMGLDRGDGAASDHVPLVVDVRRR